MSEQTSPRKQKNSKWQHRDESDQALVVLHTL